ncbi:glycosyltransferase family 2 protein [Halalkalibacillus halophilus]|uniref:glycosyltransferase family 2 protein n=1 Tax=Halalkalibacillus halophilus TaxID=392827 RepID=UPI0004004CE3|nr:glycosyltransferase family 2 protein [Halalkalibacillus halophilus]
MTNNNDITYDEHAPLVSVITPTFNAEGSIRDTIESVLEQTFTNFEVIVVDDCSQDQTVEIIQDFVNQDARVKCIQLETNQGAAIARNTAIDHAQGRYIAFLDSDDLWFPDKLEKQLTFMQENDVAFSFTKYVRMRDDGSLTSNISRAPETVGYSDLMKHCVIGCLTVMIDREKTGKIAMKNIRRRQDYALWLTLTSEGYLAYGIPEVLAKYRLGSNTVSSNKFKAAKGQWFVYRKIEKQNLLKSAYYFMHYATHGLKNKLKSSKKTRSDGSIGGANQ